MKDLLLIILYCIIVCFIYVVLGGTIFILIEMIGVI